ncbi:ABC transporter ATP-binding protein [Candidatus Caldatribacterium sp.]|uniref:ABC transporter ATP-binding protein n=1 Tax=Candidatus Caldatribacterium sp. TaxID=2282143 RepID=UPI00299AF288|nr:ABC transporter ATP-binding protein [Candidatus Caldatribacterium sp.]MDW8080531.1 ABC transporter ATP-binding protein [Candidatus Calescibacterium sp.]
MSVDNAPLLRVQGLRTYFYTDDGIVRAVDGVDLVVHQGKVLGIIGETGSGKTVLALSIMRLVQPPGRIVEGHIFYAQENGKEVDLALLDPKGRAIREIRGKHIAMIFQEPMVSLNPVYTIGEQIIENILIHQRVALREARDIAIRMLERVGIPEPEKRIDDYPHCLSGGMRQRAMIAMALVCQPKLLIADEPTTALDVTVQAQILELLKDLQRQMGMAIMIITHNLGVIAEIADFVGVMYLGKIMEYAPLEELFENPLHPYTRDLFKSIPYCARKRDKRKLEVIKGDVPDPYARIEGCPYASRCSQVARECFEDPPVVEKGDGHLVRCWLHT